MLRLLCANDVAAALRRFALLSRIRTPMKTRFFPITSCEIRFLVHTYMSMQEVRVCLAIYQGGIFQCDVYLLSK